MSESKTTSPFSRIAHALWRALQLLSLAALGLVLLSLWYSRYDFWQGHLPRFQRLVKQLPRSPAPSRAEILIREMEKPGNAVLLQVFIPMSEGKARGIQGGYPAPPVAWAIAPGFPWEKRLVVVLEDGSFSVSGDWP